MPHRAVTAGRRLALLVATAALAGCAAVPSAQPTLIAQIVGPSDAGTPRLVPGEPRIVATRPPRDGTGATSRDPGAPAFTACGRTAPDPATTDLRPHVLTPADQAAAQDRYGALPDGRLVVESAGTLLLTGGLLGAGNGYEAATAAVTPVAVADRTETAQVSLLVYDSERSGRRVAFVELRLAGAAPVRWDEEPALGIVTDGGDGGFVATATVPPTDPETLADAPFDAIDAFFPDPDDVASWHVCVLRATGGVVDGVLFATGWGDGWYGSYLGRDEGGRVVAVVSDGQVVPWEISGLPGELPPGVALDDAAG